MVGLGLFSHCPCVLPYYQGYYGALVIGVVFGLLYYFLYKYKVKNLLPFFLMHALADMFWLGLIYLLVNWNY